MFKYKINVLEALKDAGYTSFRLRKEKILGESQLSKMRQGEVIGINGLNVICNLLQCKIEDIIEHIPAESPKE